ncbi:hypothetical protein BX600DRAFT_518706 [Xylariales sp. PMI_506]|nr:hypothetical protein BX600DRAFT_518706 [Xylariales sp. PMI_506]
MAVRPITGILKKGLVVDLSIALGLGATFGAAFWHGFHLPRTHARDDFYAKLEQERAAKQGH